MLFPSYVTLDKLNTINKGNLAGHLGIEYIDIGPDYLRGRMPVNEKTKQPLGLLHGGASAAFAETMGSVAANAVVDQNKFYCVVLKLMLTMFEGSRIAMYMPLPNLRILVGQPTCGRFELLTKKNS